ncbi:unnamed protein product [Eruca vesicaria subsp. sativa]|uniref:Uncharacterized protein n=1 Tax=Eruca vesicaria subsp. sativa TaxID=29727 RepID=A0ABC8J6E8_ERUVS|nr:unnamed protein product [Eruca vesicaria subsp. sativa]
MSLMVKNNPYENTKMDKADPQELIHRRAEFLIQEVLERAGHKTRQQQQKKRSSGPLIMIRVVGIKMTIGKKLIRKMKKNNSSDCSNFISRFLKRFLLTCSSSSSRTISDLPPLFTLQV